jgi:hypothetical protein
MRQRHLAVFLALATLAALPACSSGGCEHLGNVHATHTPPAAFTAIDAEFVVGSLEVREQAGTAVDVTAEVRVRPGLLPKDGKEPALAFADWISLQQDRGTLRLRPAKSDSDHELRIVLTVPAGQRDLRLVGKVGSLTATVAAAAALHARVDVGEVRLAVNDKGPASADVELATGAMHLTLPVATPGSFDCAVDTGGINGAGRLGLEEQRSIVGSRAVGRRGQGGGTFKLHVAVGELDLDVR